MKEKTVIGLNLKYYMTAMVAAIISGVCTILPYAKVVEEGETAKTITLLGVLGSIHGSKADFIIFLAALLAVASAVLAIVLYFKTSKKGVKFWMFLQMVSAACWVALLFASKTILESAGVYTKFMNSGLRIGYWIGLIAVFVSLVMTMRVAETNVGYILLAIMGVIWLFPVLWIVITAFREEQGYYIGYFIPHGLTFQNFIDLFTHPSVLPFGRWWVNTMIVAICGCCINTMIVLMTAFILSRTRFKGRRTFMNVLMIIGMFPGFMSLIAVYNILKGIGLNQSLLALIIVGAAGAAMGYHVTKGFFDTIPKALDEAALIDGATRAQIFTRVTLPLSKSIIVYIVLGAFMGAWSDYIFPSMLFGDRQQSYTVAVGLYWMTDYRRIDNYYTQFAAGAVVVAVPIVILFVWLQRFYVEGLSGAVKG